MKLIEFGKVQLLIIFLIFQLGFSGSVAPAPNGSGKLSGPVISCGHLSVYQLSRDGKSGVHIFIDTNEYILEQENRFDISQYYPGVEITFKKFDTDMSRRLCTEGQAYYTGDVKEKKGKSGILLISMSDKEWKYYSEGKSYAIDIQGTQLNFPGAGKISLSISKALVGWEP